MAVPTAIQKQADAAEALQKQLASGTPVEIVSDTPRVVNANPQDEYVSSEPGPSPAPIAVELPQPEPSVLQPQADGETWEHKYNVLQGKYNTELTALRNEIESQNGTIANLNSLIVSLNQRVSQPQAEPSPEVQPQAGPKRLDPDDFEGYGAEMIDLVKLVQTQAAELSRLKGETNSIAERQVKTEAELYFDALDTAVKDWRIRNKDPQFLAWLKEPDGISGTSRQENMTAAHNALDAATVAKYFLAYPANGGPVNQPINPNPLPQVPGPVPNLTPVQPNLLSQVVPSDTGVSRQILQPEGQPVVVTRAQFNKAVNDKIQKRITDDEFKVISDNFQRSIAAGKV